MLMSLFLILKTWPHRPLFHLATNQKQVKFARLRTAYVFSGQVIPPYLVIELFLRSQVKGLISG